MTVAVECHLCMALPVGSLQQMRRMKQKEQTEQAKHWYTGIQTYNANTQRVETGHLTGRQAVRSQCVFVCVGRGYQTHTKICSFMH